MKHTSRVIITNNQKERVLLGKRTDRPEAGKWNIIGGKPEEGEDDNLAARRETYKETGIIIGALNFLFDDIFNDWTTHYYSTKVDDADLDLNGDHEHTELQWFAWDELDALEAQLAFNHYLILKEYAALI